MQNTKKVFIQSIVLQWHWLCYAIQYWVNFATATVYHQTKEQISNEHKVLLKCQEDPRHFAVLYEKYYEPIYLFIFKRIDNNPIASDITAKVFMNCLVNIKFYKHQGVPFSAWLYKIAINETNQFFRKQKQAERTVSIEDYQVNSLMHLFEQSEQLFDPNIIVPALLETLSEKEIQYIELRFFEQYSFKEMAYLLGTTEVNAKVKTYRIINKLKKIAQDIKYHS